MQPNACMCTLTPLASLVFIEGVLYIPWYATDTFFNLNFHVLITSVSSIQIFSEKGVSDFNFKKCIH